VLGDLQREGEVEPLASCRGERCDEIRREVRRDEFVALDQQCVAIDVVAIKPNDPADAKLLGRAQPRAAAAADIDDTRRRQQIEHRRQHGARRFETALRLIVEEGTGIDVGHRTILALRLSVSSPSPL